MGSIVPLGRVSDALFLLFLFPLLFSSSSFGMIVVWSLILCPSRVRFRVCVGSWLWGKGVVVSG